MRICLDPGHGGRDSGACFRGLKESDVVMDICAIAAVRLRNNHEVILTRDHDLYLPLSSRVSLSKEKDADIFLSIHCNADPDFDLETDPEAMGEEIWYYQGSTEGKKIAESMSSSVDKFFPDESFRGIKETRIFYVLKHTRCPAVIIETGFIDRSSTNRQYRDGNTLFHIADCIVEGVHSYERR